MLPFQHQTHSSYPMRNEMRGFHRRIKMVKTKLTFIGVFVDLKLRVTLICLASSPLLCSCRASPLYIGQFGQQDVATAPGAVLRDGRGEPILADLPPLGALPAAEVRHVQLHTPPSRQPQNK
jgi:hypothetical protein